MSTDTLDQGKEQKNECKDNPGSNPSSMICPTCHRDGIYTETSGGAVKLTRKDFLAMRDQFTDLLTEFQKVTVSSCDITLKDQVSNTLERIQGNKYLGELSISDNFVSFFKDCKSPLLIAISKSTLSDKQRKEWRYKICK